VPHGSAAVVRFSSLGDVLLAAHVPSILRSVDPTRRVLFVTKARFASALRGHPDVDRFYMLEERGYDPGAPLPLGVRGRLADLAATIRREGVTDLYDLHQNWRSTRLGGALDAVERHLPPKHALRRRLFVHARWLKPEPVPPLLRTYRIVAGAAPDAPLRPWLRDAMSDAERARAGERIRSSAAVEGRPFVVHGVGARWETKRWPVERFVRLGERLREELGFASVYAVAPEEAALEAELRGRLGAGQAGAVATVPLRDAAAIASSAAAIVSNDSAFLHLGPALGIPAIGVFGSTVPEFGFAFQGPRDDAVGIPIPCRPCDVHGKRRCPLGHHRCLRDLAPDLVLEAVRRATTAALRGREAPGGPREALAP
jgi:heptosyltransferase-2